MFKYSTHAVIEVFIVVTMGDDTQTYCGKILCVHAWITKRNERNQSIKSTNYEG